MSRLEAATASLASMLGALVSPPGPDVADLLAHLLSDFVATTGADAAALMALDSSGDLSLLAADSHRAVRMEMLQIQREHGPCVDVLESGQPLCVAGASRLVAQWGPLGNGIVEAGFEAVEAYPMRWRGAVLGGLNVFHTDPGASPEPVLGQAYADVATLSIVQSSAPGFDLVRSRMHEALSARSLVEQAKGVLAYREGIDLGSAYDALLRRADETSTPLTQTVLDIVSEASGTPKPT